MPANPKASITVTAFDWVSDFARGLAPGIKAGAIIDWLKADYDLGHGHAMSIVAWIKGKRSQTPSH